MKPKPKFAVRSGNDWWLVEADTGGEAIEKTVTYYRENGLSTLEGGAGVLRYMLTDMGRRQSGRWQ